MKTSGLMKMASVALLLLTGAGARAEGGAGTWKGAGTSFDVRGQELGDFTVELTQTVVDAQTTQMRGKVTLASGQVIPIEQRRTSAGNTFRIESNRGKGGGMCMGAGLCTSYEETGEDKAFATTIIIDGENKMRLLTTELDHGRAVRFMRQTLTRSQ